MRGDTLMWNAGVGTTLGLVYGMLALPDTHTEVLMSLGRAYMYHYGWDTPMLELCPHIGTP